MTRAALLLVVAVLASACGATVDHPAATPTAAATPASSTPTSIATPTAAVREATASSTATSIATAVSPPRAVPTSTATPNGVRVWDVPPVTGIAEVDGIIKAVTTGDVAALETYLAGMVKTLSCTTSPNGSGEVRCLPGDPSGTPTRAIPYVPGCHGEYWEIATTSPSPRGSSTLPELTARLIGSGSFFWMMSDHPWGGTDQILFFLNDRVAPTGGVGFLFDSGRATGFQTAVPGCATPPLKEFPDFVVSRGGRLVIPPPP